MNEENIKDGAIFTCMHDDEKAELNLSSANHLPTPRSCSPQSPSFPTTSFLGIHLKYTSYSLIMICDWKGKMLEGTETSSPFILIRAIYQSE